MKIIFAVFIAAFLLVGDLSAQATVFGSKRETNKSFVSVPVAVSDREGRYIADLKREDFSVFADGAPQKITFFSAYNEPVKLTLLLDTSKSTRNVIGKIRDAAKDFVSSLNARDECQLATFDSQVKIASAFTADKAAIKNALDRVAINERGGTLLYNAVNQITEQQSFKDIEGRKVIVVLTDGNDFGSSLTKDEFLSRLEESDALIYTVFFKTAAELNSSAKSKKKNKKSGKKKNQAMVLNSAQAIYEQTDEEIARLERADEAEAIDALKKMSDITAGRFYRSGADDLKRVFKSITGELTQQYRLGFDAKNADSKIGASPPPPPAREIVVKVSRPDVVVRTRGAGRGKQP